MRQTRLQIAKKDILAHFDALPSGILRHSDIARILSEQKAFWRLAQSTTTRQLIAYLLKSGRLSEFVFPFPKPYKKEVRYAWGSHTLHEVILALKPNGYFSHYTAMSFHGLTEQIPKTIYVNQEQKNSGPSNPNLTQRAIDAAMRRPVRTTGNIANVNDTRICIISGKNTEACGVTTGQVHSVDGHPLGLLRFTDLERTLIDAAVRPAYSGGVFEVRKAFELAVKRLSVNILAATLHKLQFVYPYHQVVGYYLQSAGCDAARLAPIRAIPMEFDFYLTHGMKETRYVPEWRLHVPDGF